ERRARRVRARDRLVERGLERVIVKPSVRVLDHLLARPARERVRVVARLGVHAEDASGAHVDHHRAAGQLAAARLVEGLLHVGVEREPEVAPGDRVAPARLLDDALAAGAPAALGVDEPLLPAARAAEVALPGPLGARDARAVALEVARVLQLREL